MSKPPHVKYQNIAEQMHGLLGLSNAEIAERLGCHITTVQQNRQKIAKGFVPIERFWNEERDAKLREMVAAGASASAIARVVGAKSRNAVLGRVHRLRLSCSGKSGVPSRRAAKTGRTNHGKHQPHIFGLKKGTNGKPFTFNTPNTSRVPKLPALPLPPAAEYDRARIAVADLEAEHCRWPVGDPSDAGASKPLFCGERRELGPYCLVHYHRSVDTVRLRKASVPRVEKELQVA